MNSTTYKLIADVRARGRCQSCVSLSYRSRQSVESNSSLNTTPLIRTQVKRCSFVEMHQLLTFWSGKHVKADVLVEQRTTVLSGRPCMWATAWFMITKRAVEDCFKPADTHLLVCISSSKNATSSLRGVTSSNVKSPPPPTSPRLSYVVVLQIKRLSWLAVCLSRRKMFPFVFASGECLGICCYLSAAFTHGRAQRWCGGPARSGTRLSAVSLRFLSQSGGGWRRGWGGGTLLPKFVLSAGKSSQPERLAASGQHLRLDGRLHSRTRLETSWFLMENRVTPGYQEQCCI